MRANNENSSLLGIIVEPMWEDIAKAIPAAFLQILPTESILALDVKHGWTDRQAEVLFGRMPERIRLLRNDGKFAVDILNTDGMGSVIKQTDVRFPGYSPEEIRANNDGTVQVRYAREEGWS